LTVPAKRESKERWRSTVVQFGTRTKAALAKEAAVIVSLLIGSIADLA
jgi:hypothetical protein